MAFCAGILFEPRLLDLLHEFPHPLANRQRSTHAVQAHVKASDRARNVFLRSPRMERIHQVEVQIRHV